MKRFFISGIVSSIAAALIGCETTSDIAAVKDFEPERYMGTWYEIARLPQYFERDLDEVTAQYTLEDDGTIKVLNSGKRDGEPTSAEGSAHLKNPDAKASKERCIIKGTKAPFDAKYIQTINCPVIGIPNNQLQLYGERNLMYPISIYLLLLRRHSCTKCRFDSRRFKGRSILFSCSDASMIYPCVKKAFRAIYNVA